MSLEAIRERIGQLRRSQRLDRLLPVHPGARLPWSEWLQVLWYVALLAAAVAVTVAATHRPQADVVGRQLLVAGVLVAVGACCRGLSVLCEPTAERLRRRLCRQGVVLPAALLQANDRFFAADNDEALPGTVLFSFDPEAVARPDRLRGVAASLVQLKYQDRRTLPSPLAAVAWDLYHELVPLPRRPLPPEHADGLRDCCVATVLLPPQPQELAGLYVVLALPGADSWHAVAMLPAD